MAEARQAVLDEHNKDEDRKRQREAQGRRRREAQLAKHEATQHGAAGPQAGCAERIESGLEPAVLQVGKRRHQVLGKNHHVHADDCQSGGRPEPGAPSFAQDDPRQQDRDQRLGLLQHEGLGEVSVRKGGREEDRRNRLWTHPDQPYRQPTTPVQAAHLRDAAEQKRDQEEADQGVFDDDDLRWR